MSGVTPMGPKSDSSTKRFIQDIMEQHAVGLDNMISPLSHDGKKFLTPSSARYLFSHFLQSDYPIRLKTKVETFSQDFPFNQLINDVDVEFL